MTCSKIIYGKSFSHALILYGKWGCLMSAKKNETVTVQGTEIAVLTHRKDDYISLTDMAKHKNADATGLVISHWMRTGYTLNFIGAWERLHNPDFNVTEFGYIKMEQLLSAKYLCIIL